MSTTLQPQPPHSGQVAKATVRNGGGNTSLSAVVVNQQLTACELRQLARQVHAAMARVIQPFHTIRDGDIMFSVSAGDAPRSMTVEAIGEFASRLAVSAVRSAVVDQECAYSFQERPNAHVQTRRLREP